MYEISNITKKYGKNHELIKTIKRVYELINTYGNTFDNKDHGKNLLHKMLLEGRISFREIKKPGE